AREVGFALSAAVSTLGSTNFFYLFLKSHYIPRLLSQASVAVRHLCRPVVHSSWVHQSDPAQYTATAPYGILPILIAELSTGLWLLIEGINLPLPRQEQFT